MLHLLKYVTSFIDGRVRLRHPALRDAATVAEVRPRIEGLSGMRSAAFNVQTGSVLLQYDPAVLSREELIRQAAPWAEYLDAKARGRAAALPEERRLGERKRAFPAGLCGWRKVANRGMLACLLMALAGLALNKRVHVAAGAGFALLAGAHVIQRRKAL